MDESRIKEDAAAQSEVDDYHPVSWAEVGRRALILLAVLMLAPAWLTIGLAVAFILLPVALVMVPLVVPGLFAEGANEHEHERERDALPPRPREA